MTRRDAFKIGFLTKIAETGHTPQEFQAALEKRGVNLGSVLVPLGLLAMSAPILGGIYTGKLHSELSDVTPLDVQRMKREEIIAEYLRHAERLRMQSRRRHWRKLFSKKRPMKEEEEELYG